MRQDDDRIKVSYWDADGNEVVRLFAGDIPPEEIPESVISPFTGMLAGRDRRNPPESLKSEPYKTHLAYVKERRTPEEGQAILDEALQNLRRRRGQS